jgi:hypothetical protein
MSKLAGIRGELAALRRWRWRARWGTALAGVIAAVVAILAGVFALDFMFQPRVAVRVVFLIAGAGGLYLAWRALARPWLGTRETELDMALLVQRHERAMAAAGGQESAHRGGVARDFAAALQFEGPGAASWGSAQLEQLVIGSVAAAGPHVDVFEGFSMRQAGRRAAVAAAGVGLVAIAAALYPGHAGAFVNRLLLGNAHYPSRTQLVRLSINGRDVPLENGVAPANVRCAEGQPVRFVVACTGEIPDAGQVKLVSRGGRTMSIDLAAEKASRPNERSFAARLDRLGEPLSYQIELGDAWTDPAGIDLIELPVVECTLRPVPPDYVAPAKKSQADLTGVHNIEALEGSRIEIEVACRNKALAKVAVLIDEKTYPLAPVDAERRLWRLDPKGTPFEAISKETRYKLEMLDADGQAPEHLVEGVVRIQLDRPPRIAAIIRTRHVVPQASPVVECRATDDYGLATLVVRPTILRESTDGPKRQPCEPVTLLAGEKPVVGGHLPLEAKYPLPLSRFKLAKGDQLELVLEVVDYRGHLTGKPAASEPIVLNVTDAEGVATAVTELDPKLEAEFDSLIQRQLDIGASK